MLNFNRYALLVLISLTGGCASFSDKALPPAAEPAKAKPAISKPPAVSAPAVTPAIPRATAPAPTAPTDSQSRSLVLKLLPAKLKDKDGWADDLQSAFKALQIPPSIENYCATVAIIEQESSFQANPPIPGLPAIVRREIEQRRVKYSIPQSVVDWILSTTSRDGRSYQQRLNTLKTEKQLSDLTEEIVASIPAGKKLFSNYNPVRTGGPMQVSVEFAESHARARPYPYPVNSNLRNEVFTRRGGIYFGSAILLDYPAPYDEMIYRFADFNAGRYSSRNAAFQRALSQLSGTPLAPDGDLLRYKNGNIAPESSATQRALLAISTTLQMSEAEIQRDLRLEKLSTFSRTLLYTRLFALADRSGIQPRVLMPQINLKSPKFQRKLTTKWFATRVQTRYQRCLRQR
ncbi:MAG: DUF1615 domain-containing protein [Gallionella sp.]|nr:DUF1615 domain-containing protein [Gallionella sp.]